MSGWKLVCRDCIEGREVKCIGILQRPPFACEVCGKQFPVGDNGFVSEYYPVTAQEVGGIRAQRCGQKPKCPHPDGLILDARETFPDSPEIYWCRCCGCLLDNKTDEVVAGPSDYRNRWKT